MDYKRHPVPVTGIRIINMYRTNHRKCSLYLCQPYNGEHTSAKTIIMVEMSSSQTKRIHRWTDEIDIYTVIHSECSHVTTLFSVVIQYY